MRRLTVRERLLAALALLAIATLGIGTMAWLTLDHATGRVDRLHRETIAAVDDALTLSRQAAGVATRAPYLLEIDSPYRLGQEGDYAVSVIDVIASSLEHGDPLRLALGDMRLAINELVEDMQARARLRDRALRLNAELARSERRYASLAATDEATLAERQDWFTLQRVAAALLGAGRAENLISVGEYQREYHRLGFHLETTDLVYGRNERARLKTIAEGRTGLFELRRLELTREIHAKAALVRIGDGAAQLLAHADKMTATAQAAIAAERTDTTSAISLQKSIILFVGIGSAALALSAALYVSGYVTGNLRAVSVAMRQLAAGDRSIRLPRGDDTHDEIGDLFRSFRTFRANALRLDRSNRQLRQRHALLEKVFANMTDGVAETDEAGRVRYANPNVYSILRIDRAHHGIEEISALFEDTHFATAAREKVLNAAFRGTTELRSQDGQIIEVRANRLPDNGAVWLFSDITERRKLDERLNQIQRIEALGKAAGEVAHDFGNVLSTISTNLFLLEKPRTPNESQSLLQRIANAVDIGTSLTQRLLAFARKQQLVPEIVELGPLVEGVADLVSVGLKDGVTLTAELPDMPIHVRADPGQLESAILNLCLNASQAIEGDGTIQIRVALENAANASITVTDTGIGMDEVTRAQALEPFFSARADGQGTGLGLSMVYGFMKQTGGDVKITSTLGKGTSIRLTLPTCEVSHMAAPSPMPAFRTLVIDDDPAALKALSADLEAMSHAVTRAASYAEAVCILDASPPFDLVCSDIQLEDGHLGWDLARTALDASPRTRVIIVSGRMPKRHPLFAEYSGRVGRLTKPVTATALAEAITELGEEALCA